MNMPVNQAVSNEVIEEEFARFVEAMDLDFDEKGMDDEDRKSFTEAKKKITNAMRSGNLVIDEKGQPQYTPRMGDTTPITFHEPTGASIMAMDQKREGHSAAKMFAIMADITKQNAQRFAKMANRDLVVCQAVTTLFLG